MKSKKRSDREKLLRLIDGDEKTFKDMQNRNNMLYYPRKIMEALSVVSKRVRLTAAKLLQGKAFGSGLGLTVWSKILLFILFVEVGYCVVDFVGATLLSRGALAPSAVAHETAVNTPPVKLASLNHYLDQIAGANVFNSGRASLTQNKEKESGSDIPSSYKLVGVDWGDEPTAMLEDTQSGKTYFVKVNSDLNEYKVAEIQRDKVLLTNGNQTVEIK